jgi:uncharacterized protein (TIGR02453 family)
MKAILEFLEELSKNNNREWFNGHKPLYETCRKKVLFVTEVFINEIRKFDKDIPTMDPNDCVFRIYRDIRFSLDKSPYKTHFGSFIARGGLKSSRAGYYFHIQPGESFLGGGIYMPPPDVLKALRTAIYEKTGEYSAIIGDTGFKTFFPEIEGEKLKTAPKGFPPDFKHMELIKPKSYAFGTKVPDETLISGKLVETGINAFSELYKINRFLNDALDQYL